MKEDKQEAGQAMKITPAMLAAGSAAVREFDGDFWERCTVERLNALTGAVYRAMRQLHGAT